MNKKFDDDIVEKIIHFYITDNKTQKEISEIKLLKIRYKKDMLKFLQLIYKDANFYLDRKYNKYAVLMGNC